MQLIFTLSEYDLKNASAERPSAQEQAPSEECGDTSEIYQWLEENRENRRERFKLAPVKIQSCEQIKAQFELNQAAGRKS